MDNHNTQDDWQPCPTGELSRMVTRLDSLQSGARLNQVVGTGLLSMFLCAVAVVVLGGYVFFDESVADGFSCKDCQAHAAEFHEYLLGKAGAIDKTTAKKMKKHMKKCDGCRGKFQKSYPDAPLGPLATCEPCMHQCIPKLSVGVPPAEF